MHDYNNAQGQRSFDVIPDGTTVVAQMNVRPGGAGEGGILKRTKNGDAEGLDIEFIVVEGEHAKKRFWGFWLTGGTTDGHAAAADITMGKLRAVLESARGIKPTDVSETAKKARLAELTDFDGIRFMCKLGVEPARGDFKAKNFVSDVITPDRKEWRPIAQEAKPAAAANASSANASSAGNVTPIARPSWAQ